MAGCRIVNAAVEGAVENFKTISDTYKSDGEAFIQALNAAIAEMEGETKDALKTFIDNDVKKFVEVDLPEAVKGMAELLEANSTTFVDVDKKIADSISGS